MLLTPEHFRRSDSFSVELFEWLLRNTSAASGLVGGGPRLPRGERGLQALDPQFHLHDDGSRVEISVHQARGVTPDGGYVEIGPPRVIRRSFARDELTGSDELVLYVVRTQHDEADEESVGIDPAIPLQHAYVQEGYRIELGVRADDAGRALAIGRVRRVAAAQTLEKDAQFIPPSASMMGHSSLYAGWEEIQGEVRLLASGFGDLHRLVATSVENASRVGKPVRNDQSISALVERVVLALDTCAYETLDPSRAPALVFQQVERAARTIALALDVSEATREYLTLLGSEDATYTGLLRDERQALESTREVVTGSDLRVDLDRASEALLRVRSLLRAIEARYLDYRINPAIDTLRFMIDSGGERFFTLVARPSNMQSSGDLLTISFSQLNLAAAHSYRLLLLADPGGVPSCQEGDVLRPTVRINAAAGGARPQSADLLWECYGQRNFALDLAHTDVQTINSLNVAVQPARKVRSALLYQRSRQLGAAAGVAPQPEMGSGSHSSVSIKRKPVIIGPRRDNEG